jgi:hypothetical protein
MLNSALPTQRHPFKKRFYNSTIEIKYARFSFMYYKDVTVITQFSLIIPYTLNFLSFVDQLINHT